MLLIEWGLAFGAGRGELSRALQPLNPQRQRQERLSVPGSVRASITVQTSLASGVTLTPIPQSCLLPALPSGVEGVGRVMPSVAAVSRSHGHGAPA